VGRCGKDNINLGAMHEAVIVKPVKGIIRRRGCGHGRALEELSKEMAADIKTCHPRTKGSRGNEGAAAVDEKR